MYKFTCVCHSNHFFVDAINDNIACSSCHKIYPIKQAKIIASLNPNLSENNGIGTFIILKKTVSIENPTVDDAYRGATCEIAGVEAGKVYSSRSIASNDAQRLTHYSGIGFVVVPIEDWSNS